MIPCKFVGFRVIEEKINDCTYFFEAAWVLKTTTRSETMHGISTT